MTSGNSKNNPLRGPGIGGQGLPTLGRVKDTARRYSQRKSAEMISDETGVKFTHRDIGRLLQGKEPDDIHKRLALGLPAYAKARVCPIHGVAHEGKCPGKRKPPRDLWDWPVKALAEAIRNRS